MDPAMGPKKVESMAVERVVLMVDEKVASKVVHWAEMKAASMVF